MNWRTVAFLLESAVFLLIGLQAEWIIQDVGDERASLRPRSSLVCAAALLAVIVVRLVWVFAGALPADPAGADPTPVAGRRGPTRS